MSDYFYDFMLGDMKAGYTYLKVDSSVLYSHTHFKLPSDELITNVFTLNLEDSVIMSCTHNEQEPVDFSKLPSDHFPGCAYPLFLARAVEDDYTYTQISEDDGSVVGKFTLKRIGADIVEYHSDQECRRFTLANGLVNRIDWGGAVSHLRPDAESAIKGSPVQFIANRHS